MIPIYIFYSMFGFQRTGDGFWAAADQMARGFLLGATAGRTTLNGEGLQHEDGHSLLLAATNPAVVAYDPAFAFEIAHITENGCAGCTASSPENVFYYLTVYNEPIHQPAEPADVDVEGLLKGIYRYAAGAGEPTGPKAQILASGTGMQWALQGAAAARRGLGRGGRRVVGDLLDRAAPRRGRVPRSTTCCTRTTSRGCRTSTRRCEGTTGPVVAVSDFMRAVPDLIARWVPDDYTSLGTDGFGLSDTRHALRRHFHVDAESIVVGHAAPARPAAARCRRTPPAEAAKKYAIDDVNAAPVGETGGDS